MKSFSLQHVHFIPKQIEEGILYYSDEFEIAVHLCPCGCKNRIVTPIGPVDWSFKEEYGKPTLYPSIGNWQIPCRSHYWITKGEVTWSRQWSDKEIMAGRENEQMQKEMYYNKKKKKHFARKLFNWIYRKSGN